MNMCLNWIQKEEQKLPKSKFLNQYLRCPSYIARTSRRLLALERIRCFIRTCGICFSMLLQVDDVSVVAVDTVLLRYLTILDVRTLSWDGQSKIAHHNSETGDIKIDNRVHICCSYNPIDVTLYSVSAINEYKKCARTTENANRYHYAYIPDPFTRLPKRLSCRLHICICSSSSLKWTR